MDLQDHVTNENHYISFTRVVMSTKLSRMINYLDGLLLRNAQDPLITLDKLKSLYLQYHGTTIIPKQNHNISTTTVLIPYFEGLLLLESTDPLLK